MARPTKAVVDYFPLVCEFSDSIKYIENIYGNDGVAFWIKLLQKLGRTENHFIDCRNNTKWKILYGEMKIDEVICENILNDLAELECIDKEFWDKKVIYSENFVLGIKDAYKKRTVEFLSKGQLFERLFNFCGVSGVGNSVSGVGNPQSKVKEIKEDKSKEDKKENIDIFCNSDFQKTFTIYSENCKNLLPLLFEKRSRDVLTLLGQVLEEIDYDFEQFKELCIKANSLEKIVNSKIDFKSMLKNYIGILSGKYETGGIDTSKIDFS